MTERRRSLPARIGVAALNIPVPGLGLIRLGEGRAALYWFAASTTIIFGTALLFFVIPAPNFVQFVALIITLLTLLIGVTGASIVMTWRKSQTIAISKPWWSCWYGVALAWSAAAVLPQLAVLLAHRSYKPFHSPAESMTPTIAKGDKFIADMHDIRAPHLGQIVLIDTPNGIYVKRIAALPGDRIAMRNGIPVVNGQPARQRADGLYLLERLPGEPGWHHILDTDHTWTDDMREIRVPVGHIFLLGDNRDNSADSRIPQASGGLGAIPLTAVRGQPLFIYWSSDRSRIGKKISG